MRSPNQHLFQRIRTTHTTILNGIGYLFVCARIHECEMSRKTLCKAVCGYGLWPMHPVMSEFCFFIGVPVASDDLHCTRAHCVRWLIARWPITTIIAACASNTQNCRHNRLSNQCMHSSAVAQSKPTKHWTTQIDRHTHIVRRPNCLVICQSTNPLIFVIFNAELGASRNNGNCWRPTLAANAKQPLEPHGPTQNDCTHWMKLWIYVSHTMGIVSNEMHRDTIIHQTECVPISYAINAWAMWEPYGSAFLNGRAYRSPRSRLWRISWSECQ